MTLRSDLALQVSASRCEDFAYHATSSQRLASAMAPSRGQACEAGTSDVLRTSDVRGLWDFRRFVGALIVCLRPVWWLFGLGLGL